MRLAPFVLEPNLSWTKSAEHNALHEKWRSRPFPGPLPPSIHASFSPRHPPYFIQCLTGSPSIPSWILVKISLCILRLENVFFFKLRAMPECTHWRKGRRECARVPPTHQTSLSQALFDCRDHCQNVLFWPFARDLAKMSKAPEITNITIMLLRREHSNKSPNFKNAKTKRQKMKTPRNPLLDKTPKAPWTWSLHETWKKVFWNVCFFQNDITPDTNSRSLSGISFKYQRR